MEQKFAALESLGAAGFEHKNGTLHTHLLATYELLKRWGASAALCDAGLYHSAYSTTGFTKTMVSLDLRSNIAAIIGNVVSHPSERQDLIAMAVRCRP